MLKYVSRRLASLLFVALGVITVVFCLTYMIPGDPARMAAGIDASEEQVESVRRAMGLDRPVYVQYFSYLGKLLRGDMGTSIRTMGPVSEDLLRLFPSSIELVIVAFVLLIVVAVPIGIFIAVHRFSPVSVAARVAACVGVGIPVFWLALILQLLFAMKLRWLPIAGRLPAGMIWPERVTNFLLIDSVIAGDWEALRAGLMHIILPAMTLAIARSAMVIRLTAASLMDVLNADYIRTARAKGLAERVVIYRHALKNAMIPVITFLGLSLGFMLGGAVLVETIFSWPGVGSYVVYGVKYLDYPAVVGGTLFIALSFSVINLSVDIAYAALDPRIRSAGAR